MTGSLVVFIISFIVLAVIYLTNLFYKSKPQFLETSDANIINLMHKSRQWYGYMNRKTLNLLLHYLLEKLETFSSRVFRKLKNVVKK